MATFLMVHGAWHGAWTFDNLRQPVEQAGHTLMTPDLPGTQNGCPEDEIASLQNWADFIASCVEQAESPVILCAHSRGGIVISEVAERVSDSIQSLVYITAFLVPNGKNQADIQLPRPAEFSAGIKPTTSGDAVTVSEDAALACFYNTSPKAEAEAAAKRLVPEKLAIRESKLTLSNERFGTVPRHFIECLEDAIIPIKYQRAMQKELPAKTVTTLKCDHSPFLSCPNELTEALLIIANE